MHLAIVQEFHLTTSVVILGLVGLTLLGVVAFAALGAWLEYRGHTEPTGDLRAGLFFLAPRIVVSLTILTVAYGLGRRAPPPDTSAREEDRKPSMRPSQDADQASKPISKPEEPKAEQAITVKSTTCLVKEVRTSEPTVSTAETAELLVTLAVPSNARECHDTVTVDAPTFGMGKEATQPDSVVRPDESYVARWLLDPEKPGRWVIAVETKKERELVPVAVTTPLGFTATWIQAGAILAGSASIVFGVLAFLRRHGGS